MHEQNEVTPTPEDLAELRRKAGCWDALQDARRQANLSPDDSGWKAIARQEGLIPGTRACRASLGISLTEARDCVASYLAKPQP